jgi:hypothetical protein
MLVFMGKSNLLEVSDEVVGILRAGGIRCKCFLDEVAEHQSAITAFCRYYRLKLSGIDISAESGNEEPAYTFSDRLGSYTRKGLILEQLKL